MKSTFDQFVIFSGFTSEMPTTRTHWFNYRNLFPMPQGALDPHLPAKALFAQLSMNHVTALASTDATDADTIRDVAIVKKTVRPPVLDLSLDSGEAFTFKQPRKPCRIEEECAFGPIWALHSRRGKRRAHREDTFCAHPFYLQLSDNDPVSIFGVFDGHGGDHASRYTSKRLPVLFSSLLKKSENIRQALTNAFLIVDKELTEKSSPEKKAPKVNPAESFKRANSGGFLGSITLQRALSGSKSSAASMEACSPQVFRRANSKAEEQISSVVASTHVACGTTATAVVLSRNKLIVAHVGDSRAVLSLRDGTAIRLSEDHRPTREDEKSRVEEAGGVFFDEKDPRSMRVDGILAITRAIGRPDLRSSVIPDPEVSVRVLDGEEDFFVIASDGLWDYVQDEECVAVVRDALGGDCMSVSEKEGAAAKELVKRAWECGSTDDISVLVVNLERYRRSLNSFDGQRAKSLWRKADFENGRINSTARGAEGGEGGHEFRFNSTHDDDEGEAQLPLETPRYLPNRTHW